MAGEKLERSSEDEKLGIKELVHDISGYLHEVKLSVQKNNEGHEKGMVNPEVLSYEAIENYKYIVQRSQASIRLVNMLQDELVDALPFKQTHTKPIESALRAVGLLGEKLEAYSKAQFLYKNDDGTFQMKDSRLIISGDANTYDGSFPQIIQEINRIQTEMYHAYTHATIVTKDGTKKEKKRERAFDETKQGRLDYLFGGIQSILVDPEQAGDLKTDLYFTLDRLHGLRDPSTTNFSESTIDDSTLDLLNNSALMQEKLFNTRQPILRFAQVDYFKTPNCPSITAEDYTISNIKVSKYQPNQATLEAISAKEKEQKSSPVFTNLFDKKQYYYQFTFGGENNGQVGYYQKSKMTFTEATASHKAGEEIVYYTRMGLDYGDKEDNKSGFGLPNAIFPGPNSPLVPDALDSAVITEQNMDTGKGIPFGRFTQETLQTLLKNPDISLDDLKNFIEQPYQEGGIINMIEDQVHKYRKENGGEVALDDDQHDFMVSWMLREIKVLYNDDGKGKLNAYEQQIKEIKDMKESLETDLIYTDFLTAIEENNQKINTTPSSGDAIDQDVAKEQAGYIDLSQQTPARFEAVKQLAADKKAGKPFSTLDSKNILKSDTIVLTEIFKKYNYDTHKESIEQKAQSSIDYHVAATTHQAKLDFTTSLLTGLFEAKSKSWDPVGDACSGVTGYPPSERTGQVAEPLEDSLVRRYPDLAFFADIQGIGNRNLSDKTTATALKTGKELALQVALTAISGGLAGYAARRSLMRATSKIALQGGEKVADYAHTLYLHYKYIHSGAKFGNVGMRLLANTTELAINASAFHLSHSILNEVASGYPDRESLQKSLRFAGFAKSFVTLGVLKQFGITSAQLKSSVFLKQNIESIKTKFASAGFSFGSLLAEAGVFVGVDKNWNAIIGMSEEMQAQLEADPVGILEEYLEAVAFVIGLKVSHRPTSGLNKTSQKELADELFKDSKITIGKDTDGQLLFDFVYERTGSEGNKVAEKYRVSKSTEWMLQKQVLGNANTVDSLACQNALTENMLIREDIFKLRAEGVFDKSDTTFDKDPIIYHKQNGYDVFTVDIAGDQGYVSYQLWCKGKERFVVNNHLFLPEGERGGRGLDILGKQIDVAKRLGCSAIYSYCAASGEFQGKKVQRNGAYARGVMGFDFDTGGEFYQKTLGSRLPGVINEKRTALEKEKNIKSLDELLNQPDGTTYWKNNSFSFEGKFDLADGSPSMKRFGRYKQAKEAITKEQELNSHINDFLVRKLNIDLNETQDQLYAQEVSGQVDALITFFNAFVPDTASIDVCMQVIIVKNQEFGRGLHYEEIYDLASQIFARKEAIAKGTKVNEIIASIPSDVTGLKELYLQHPILCDSRSIFDDLIKLGCKKFSLVGKGRHGIVIDIGNGKVCKIPFGIAKEMIAEEGIHQKMFYEASKKVTTENRLDSISIPKVLVDGKNTGVLIMEKVQGDTLYHMNLVKFFAEDLEGQKYSTDEDIKSYLIKKYNERGLETSLNGKTIFDVLHELLWFPKSASIKFAVDSIGHKQGRTADKITTEIQKLQNQLEIFEKKMRERGLIHEDFHIGNVLISYDPVSKSCKLTVIDFGMVDIDYTLYIATRGEQHIPRDQRKKVDREEAINGMTSSESHNSRVEDLKKKSKPFRDFLSHQHKSENKKNKGKQNLNAMFEEELYDIWQDFGQGEAEQIANNLNQVKEVGKDGKPIQHDGHTLHQNLNNKEFYRDGNYSLSLVKDGKEIAMVSFFPKNDKVLEIVQIQGQKGYDVPREYFDFLINYLKSYAEQLGFEGLHILRGDKNYHYRAPGDFRGTDQEFKAYQENLKKIYNGYPARYRGFSKPGDWYSEYNFQQQKLSYDEKVQILQNSRLPMESKAADLLKRAREKDGSTNYTKIFTNKAQQQKSGLNEKDYLAYVIDEMHKLPGTLFALTYSEKKTRITMGTQTGLTKEAIKFLLDGGYCAFELSRKHVRSQEAGGELIESMKNKSGMIMTRENARSYSKVDREAPITLFETNGKRNAYGNLEDKYQHILMSIYADIADYLPRGQGLGTLSDQHKTMLIKNLTEKFVHNPLIEKIGFTADGFLEITMMGKLNLESDIQTYSTKELKNPNSRFPSRIWKGDQISSMYTYANQILKGNKTSETMRKGPGNLSDMTVDPEVKNEVHTFCKGNYSKLADFLGATLGYPQCHINIKKSNDKETYFQIKVDIIGVDPHDTLNFVLNIEKGSGGGYSLEVQSAMKEGNTNYEKLFRHIFGKAKTLPIQRVWLMAIGFGWQGTTYYGHNVWLKYGFDIPANQLTSFYTDFRAEIRSRGMFGIAEYSESICRKEVFAFYRQQPNNPMQTIYRNPILRAIWKKHGFVTEQELK